MGGLTSLVAWLGRGALFSDRPPLLERNWNALGKWHRYLTFIYSPSRRSTN
jgi:hypothetical protein